MSSLVLSDESRAWTRIAASAAVLGLPLVFALVRAITPRVVSETLAAWIGSFLTLSELYPSSSQGSGGERKKGTAWWKAILLCLFATVQSAGWIVLAGWHLALDYGLTVVWMDALLSVFWIYAALVPVLEPREYPRPSLVLFYSVNFFASSLTFLTTLYRYSQLPPLPHEPLLPNSVIIIESISLGVSLILIAISLSMAAQVVPDDFLADNEKEIRETGSVGSSPEDWTSVWGWITFNWCSPLIKRGSKGELKESEVHTLSPTQRSAALYAKFKATPARSLLFRCLKTNGFDLLLDAFLTWISVVLDYASPYFMKQILDALSDPTDANIASGFVYASLAFLGTILKAESDVNHLWFSRRAAVRVKSELTSAIYEKALKRKDASGVGEGKGAAGVGKIVNLMAGDTNRISNMVSGLYMLYSAPLAIGVCCTFLYSLLSWSAFAGIIAIVLAMPLNHYLSSRNVAIQKQLLAARDKRLNVMNELIGAIKFIKFFAWERQWTGRVIEAREEELRVMIKDRINGIYFSLLWMITPMAVTILSFLSYIQLQDGKLSASTAFTALSLFTMLRGPLNVIPMFVVNILQTHVAIVRIDDFLKEDEVPTFVSSLKMAEEPASARKAMDGRIGFIGASFKWNSGNAPADKDKKDNDTVKKKTDDDPKKKKANGAENATAVAANGPDEEDGSATEPAVFELQDINFIFPSGALTIITGQTGAGKSALLSALLGEMTIEKGYVLLPKDTTHVSDDGLTNSVAVCTQTAWLQNSSIKNNILFGSKFDERRYAAVVSACCLLPDFKQLEDGDETEIGSKGVSLSGGQKARVALARAVYSRAKNILLDDPLAAVDSHTAASLVSECLGGPLLKDRTVIIVSHHVELLLPITHSLIRIVDGRVEASGTIEELREAGHLSAIIATEEAEHVDETALVPEIPEADVEAPASDAAALANGVPKKEARKMVKDEEKAVGNVQWKTYKLYIEASTWRIWILTLILMLAVQIMTQLERIWLKEWTSAYENSPQTPGTSFVGTRSLSHGYDHAHAFASGYDIPQHHFFATGHSSFDNASFIAAVATERPSADDHPLYYLGIYSIITLGSAAISVIQIIVGYVGAYRAAKVLHNQMLNSVIHSTTRWFDTTPSGRIVNRFSRDQETVDGQLAQSLRIVATWTANLFVAIFIVAGIIPTFILPALFVSFAYLKLSQAYIRCGRDLRRIEAIARSPIISGFSETLEGIIIIRAWGAEARFLANLQIQVDKSQAAFYWIWMLNRWLLLRFDCLGGLSVFITSTLILGSGASAGLGGIALLAAQGFVSAVYWLCRFWSQLEMDLNSIERVEEYLHLPQEPPSIIESNRPPAYWPSSSGETLISVENLVIAYSPELPPVIHDVSFDIKPKEKIGLIGRTGSGKSTLGMSFLRFADPISGRIIIDGIDITKIGLEDLRSRVTIIPQDAVLFSGTIRENLDPFKEHTDDELLDALQRAQLGPSTPSAGPSRVASGSNLVSLDDGAAPAADAEDVLKANSIVVSVKKVSITLDSEVAAGGSNFSQGQRQLLAMARALLRNSSIIIMDESTASVDMETDSLLQKMIREEFKDSCLITIAHRLSSIIDYDRLLVLDHGRLVEFATPYELLTKPEGEDAVFAGMVRKSGKWNELFESAERKARADGLI